MGFRSEARRFFKDRSITNAVVDLGFEKRGGAYWAVQKWLSGNRETLPIDLRRKLATYIDYRGGYETINDDQRDFRVRMGR